MKEIETTEKQATKSSLSVFYDPLTILNETDQQRLGQEVMQFMSQSFGNPEIKKEDTLPTIFGRRGGGKTVAILRGKNNKIESLMAGQMLTEKDNPNFTDADSVFHISTAHSLPSSPKTVRELLTAIILEQMTIPKYISALTQSPRIYEYAYHLFRGNVYPDYKNEIEMSSTYGKVVNILKNKVDFDNFVFREKANGNFYSVNQMALDDKINSWFYNDIKVVPMRGDLLLFLGKITL